MNRDKLKTKLADFISDLKYQEKSDSTLTKYKTDILKFVDYIQHDESITKDDTMAYKDYLFEQFYSPRSIN